MNSPECGKENPDTGQSDETPQAKTSNLAIASFAFALLSIISLFIFPRAIIDDICFLIFLISIPLALVFGIISIFQIIISKSRLKGKALAIAGIVISGLLAAYVIYVIVSLSSPGCTAYPILYRTSMKSPGNAVPKKQFKCLGNEKARSNYAINPNTNWNSPPDMVSLF